MPRWSEIRQKLDELRERDRDHKVFGAASHRYQLNEPLSPGELGDFEERISVRLPDDYRAYLLEYANGGAGPAYGVYKAGRYFDGVDDLPWEEGDFVGNPAGAFRFSKKWNLPSAYWATDLDGEASARATDAAIEALSQVGFALQPPTGRLVAGRNPFTGEALLVSADPSIDGRYLQAGLMDGAIPICYLGDNLCVWLAVSGPERGHIWRDLRADYGGLEPVVDDRRARLTFADWYDGWLDAALSSAR